MNHSYRLIWSHRSHCFVAVGEHARRRGKSVKGATVVVAGMLAAAMSAVTPASAGPTGGIIPKDGGQGSITRPDANITIITQTSPRLAIDWTSFSSAYGERISFNQPNSSSIALNRVVGAGRSELMGSLAANGQVFVINPNGVLFGPNASVDVGGLLASTLNMDPAKFLEGSQVLEGGGIGTVVNRGKLTATEGGVASNSGYIALVGPRVINEGTISAVQGRVLMAAGDSVTLTLDGRSLAGYTINRGSLDALVENSGTISANGGRVTLDARAADKLSQAVVNHTGVIEAQTLRRNPGSIELLGGIKSADMEAGDMYVAGKLDVSAPDGGNGGSVKTSAARVNIGELAQVSLLAQELGGNTNGTWTNTSRDFLIAAGEGPQTTTSIGAVTLSQKLSSASQNPATANIATGTGDLYVNAPVTSESGKNLTLSASGNIYINADIHAAKGGSLLLEYGQGVPNETPNYSVRNGAKIYLQDGNNFHLRLGKLGEVNTYRVISKPGAQGSTSGNDLQGISNAVNAGRYVLGDDIDASATKTWNNGTGFIPIGGFQGTLDGLGHTIRNLYIKSTESLWVGLIRDLTSNGRVQNLVLENAEVTNNGSSPTTAVGALVGKNDGKIFNVHATTSVKSAYNNAGGLVGINNGEIKGSSAIGTVTFEGTRDAEATGGLVGRQMPGSTIIDSYAMATVSGNGSVGGLVGLMEKRGDNGRANPIVTGSYAAVSADGKGSVQGKTFTGGLVGYLESGLIEDSYAALPVTGGDVTGGLVGFLGGAVQRTYATGLVKSASANQNTVGGLVGDGSGNAFNSFWNKETTGQNSSRGGNGAQPLTTDNMQRLATFKGRDWKIDDEGGNGTIWRIYDGQTAPLLRSFLVTKDVETRSVTYNAQTQIGCAGMPCDSDSAPGNLPLTAASGRNAGTFAPYSTQQGYDIRGGKLIITPVLLTPTTNAPEKVYDGTTNVLQQLPLYLHTLGSDDVTAKYASLKYDTKNAGNNKTVTFSGITLGGNNAGNYEIADAFSVGNGKITPLTVSLSGTEVASKVYDGNKTAKVSNVGALGKTIQDDDIGVSAGSAEFNDKNVAEKKTVTVSGLTLTGNDAGNYLLDRTTITTTAGITPLTVSLSGTEAANKVYDGNKAADILNVGTLDKAVAGDAVIVNVSAAEFNDKNVAQKKTVTVSGLTLAGEDAGNYRLDKTTVTTIADITPLTLSLSGTAVASKVYDGNKSASVSNIGTLDKAIKGDDISASAGSAEFSDKNVAEKKTVTVSGLTLTGNDARNYLLGRTTITTTADITPFMLSLSGTEAANKVYDGGKAATLTKPGTLENSLGKDVVTLNATFASAAFADKNVGMDKAVTVSGLALEGADAANYRINNPSVKASITARPLSLSRTEVADKVYDGSTVAKVSNVGTLDNKVEGDVVKASADGATAAFADKNAGTGKQVTVKRVALTGADAANYALDSTQTATATIRPRPLAVRAQGVDKIYDGNTFATVTLGDNRIEGDKLDLRYAKASFADGNAGSGKTVSVAGIAASGADAGNYVADTNAVTTASIGKASLTITANPDSKAFDGKAYRGGNGVTYAGFANGENAAVLSGQPSYGGDAQGAVDIGSYRIAPAGYASQNYAIVYMDGKLTIQQPPLEPVYQAAGTVVAATAAAMSDAATNPDRTRLLSQQATLQVTECGTRLPAQPLAVVVDCNEGRASKNASDSTMSASGF
jgi:filamentous hemagglutinin family protein